MLRTVAADPPTEAISLLWQLGRSLAAYTHDLSTLVHQVLSVIVQRGGARAAALFELLRRRGPLKQVHPDLFVSLLRRLDDREVAMISKGPDASVSALGRLAIECSQGADEVGRALSELSTEPAPDGRYLARLVANLRTEKFHPVLSDGLLAEDVASSCLVADRVPGPARAIVDGCT